MKTKRCFPTVATSDDATDQYSTLWTTSLPGDLLLLIAWRVLAGEFLDYIRFRAVCRPWRDGTVSPHGRSLVDPRFHPRRWLMFPEGHGLHPGHNKLRGHLRFLNLDIGTYVHVKLPHFNNHCIIDSVDGLLLLQRDHDSAVRLLHPFTGDLADLPSLSSLQKKMQSYMHNDHYYHLDDERDSWFFSRIGMVASISCDANAAIITVMILFHRVFVVAFATTEDTQWNVPSWFIPPVSSPLSFRGSIYMVVQLPIFDVSVIGSSLVFRIDPPPQAGSPPPLPNLVAICPADKLYCGYHLVVCGSEILVVGFTDNSCMDILMYKLEDLMLERFVPVTSIRDRALFISNQRSLSVSTKAMPTSVPTAQLPGRAKWQELTERWCPAAGRSGWRRVWTTDLGRRLSRRHNNIGVDAWQLPGARAQLLGRRLGRRHSALPGLTAVSRPAGPTRTVPTATVPTASSDRRAGICADGQACADGVRVCAEAILCRRCCADGSRRHRRGPTAVDPVPTAAGRRPLGWFL
ncbi:hypothetical protein QYE76_059649 [Lolium multiflorum]|uniref:KIB1-4 beta-propeller domain-containing protein n=1 Tax=Lolium multiflorum TaxID=4521 RepID=A0AAD8RYF1_LOLMU|nr:hypothetical protein QYE76_059649 [Lolium multiflorum]